jgi:SAM-dependent methyltransferase
LLEIEEQISDYDELAEFEVDDEEDAPKRVGLAKDGAISILEVGCGDAPLGRDLAKGIQQLESATGVAASNILKRVVCIDYARTVIDSMKKEQEKEKTESSKKPQAVPVVYEVGDARKLSYSDSSFELILEKGTLDAMLSDTTIGTENCRLIVAECGRLLSIGGCLLIVSHLNAHVDSGLQWLDQIVVPGLRMSGGLYKWEIEVHGNSVDIPPALDENEKEEELPESPGPAVYIINKGEAAPKANEMEEKETEDDLPTIPLRFFSY